MLQGRYRNVVPTVRSQMEKESKIKGAFGSQSRMWGLEFGPWGFGVCSAAAVSVQVGLYDNRASLGRLCHECPKTQFDL